MPKIPKLLIQHFYHTLLFCLLWLVLMLPLFSELNFLILDKLQGNTPTRSEIIIVAIDDKSLSKLGAWPWNRDILAKGLQNILKEKPAVVGVDILFLEPRSGDQELSEVLKTSNIPIVLGNKIDGSVINSSFFEGEKITQGYTNITPDKDGKIRQSLLLGKVQNYCTPSLPIEILKQYFRSKKAFDCDSNNKLGANINFTSNINFTYSSDPFQTISFSDLYDQSSQENSLKDKIVLIGVATNDIKSGISDNFIGIDGNDQSGVALNANIINSLLQGRLQQNIVSQWFWLSLYIFSSCLIFLYQKLKMLKWEIFLLTISLLILNVIGVILFEYGINWAFTQINAVLIFSFVGHIGYRYIAESAKNRFLQNAFSKYINNSLLQTLLQNQETLKLGGEQKEMTVLFSDIRGFTTLSESKTPEELIHIINLYLEKMCNVILKNNGTIDKFIGDAIMAFWNAPLDDKNHHYNAVLTSLEMQEALEDFNKEQGLNLKIGVGINSGQMVVGNVGSQLRFDYTVLGDNVNLGSRLESLTKQYGITTLVAETTVNYINSINQEKIIFRLLDEVIVKGKNIPIKIYEPLLNNPENQIIKKDYEEAFQAYQRGNIDLAKIAFTKFNQDSVSKIMLNRLESLDLNDWDGVWKWAEK